MSFQGDLDSVGLANIFQNLTADQQTGTLHVFDRQSELFLVFSHGSIRSVSRGKRINISLGDILIARGKLDEASLAKIPEEIQRNYELLGRTLIDSGMCAQQDIDEALRFQMEEEIYDLFIWKNAKFTFEEITTDTSRIPSPLRLSSVSLNPASILMEAMRRIDEWERIRKIVPTAQLIPVIAEERQADLFAEELTPSDRHILSFIDGIHDVDTIIRKSCLGRFHVTSLAARLIQSGSLREATPEETEIEAMKMEEDNRLADAARLYRRLSAIRRNDIEPREGLARTLDKLGCNKEAAQVYLWISERYQSQNESTQALSMGKRAAELTPSDPVVLEKLAGQYLQENKKEESIRVWIQMLESLERRGEMRKAIEKSEHALDQHPDDPELLKIRARLLLSEGETHMALPLYERLSQTYASNGNQREAVAALKVILRHKPERTDLQKRLRYLQEHAAVRRRRKRRRLIAVLVVLAIFAVMALTVQREMKLKETVMPVITACRQLQDPPIDKHPGVWLSQIDKAIAQMESVTPSMSFLGLQREWQNELDRLVELRISAQQEYDAFEGSNNDTLVRWNELTRIGEAIPDNLIDDMTRLSTIDPATPSSSKAKRILEKFQKRVTSRQDEARELVRKVGDTLLPAATRFAAYNQLKNDLPEALNAKEPVGVIGLTLPVKLVTTTADGIELNAGVRIGRTPWPQQTPCVIEMPCDSSVPVSINRRGFMAAPDTFALNRITPELHIILNRQPLWTAKLDQQTPAPAALNPSADTAYVALANGQLVALETATGLIRWQNREHVPLEKAFVNAHADRVFFLTDGGDLRAFSALKGELLWQRTGEQTLARSATGMAITRLFTRPAGEDDDGTVDILVTSRSVQPLLAVGSGRGMLLWPRAQSQRQILADTLGRPVGTPFHYDSYVLTLRDDGRLVITVDNGAMPRVLDLGLTRTVDLPPVFVASDNGDVLLYLVESGGAVNAFVIHMEKMGEAKLLWRQDAFRNARITAPLVMTENYLIMALDDNRIVRIARKNGAFSRKPDTVAARNIESNMGYLNSRLYAVSDGSQGVPSRLMIFQMGDEGIRQESTINLQYEGRSSGVTVFADIAQRRGIALVAAGSAVYCFEDEWTP